MPKVNEREFKWLVSQDGYRLVNAQELDSQSRGKAESFLILTDGNRRDLYEINAQIALPLKNNALFHDCACLESEEDVIAFTNINGYFSTEMARDFLVKDSGGLTTVYGEKLEDVLIETRLLRHSINLWKLMKDRDRVGLSSYIKKARSEKDPLLAPMLTKRTTAGSEPTIADLEFELLLRKEDDFLFAASFVRNQVTKHLEGHITVEPGDLERWSIEPGFNFMPDSLLSGMWTEFAVAIDAGKDYRQCKICKHWFEFRDTGDRPSKQYCSNACRLKAYRKRQDDARRLRASGSSFEEIARKLGTDVKTVKGWIEKK